jgi:hypothetical protein
MKIGTTDIADLRIGTALVLAVYVGSTLVWIRQ